MPLQVVRKEVIPDGVFGTLVCANMDNARIQFFTVEDDWRNNHPRISCIPAGEYKLHRTIYRKHGYETFEIMDVPDRSRILIHPANTEEDLMGCIGIGMRYGHVLVPEDEDTHRKNVLKKAVVESQKAFHLFMDFMKGYDQDTITIEWAPGLP